MNDSYYRFEIGSVRCIAVSDGSHQYRLDGMVDNVPLSVLQTVLAEHGLPVDHLTTPYTFPYAEAGNHRVLVDMGAARWHEGVGLLAQSLSSAGVSPSSIDTVIISHAHPDHIGGTLDSSGHLVYPNARYFISRIEWDYWFSDAPFSSVPADWVAPTRNSLAALKDRVTLIEGEDEVLPGVRAIPAPGHTPGHLIVSFRSEGRELVYVADTAITPLHLEHPEWVTRFDILPDEAAASKRAVFDRMAEEGTLVLAQHFPPFPSLGHIEKRGGGWLWKPLEISQ